MEAFYRCIKASIDECQKTGLNLSKDISKVEVDNCIDINFDLPVNRIAFLYKFGTLNIHFFKECFLDFFSNCPEIPVVFERVLSSKLICSLSNGPGTDIVGLQLAVRKLGFTFDSNIFFKIISKYGSWRNTMNFLIESKTNALPVIGNFKLLQCNIMSTLSSKAENCLKTADVVLMDHAFAFPSAPRVRILNTLKILLQILKQGAYIFLIDTENEMPFFELLNSYGRPIYGPKIVQVEDLPYNEIVAAQIGQEPVRCGKAYFGVWQKNITTENIIVDGVSAVNVIPATNNSDKVIENVPAASDSLKMKIKNKTTGFVNEVPSKQNFEESASGKTITSQLCTPLVNLIPVMKKQSNSCKNNTSPQLHISTDNLPASVVVLNPNVDAKEKNVSSSFTSQTDSTAQADLVSKQNVGQMETNCREDIKALIQSLNILVSKLEKLLSSEMTCSRICDEHRPVCHHRNYNLCHCCMDKRCCFKCCEHGFTTSVCSNSNLSCNCKFPDK